LRARQNVQSDALVLSSLTISALIRCTTLVPVPHSRAVLRMPLPLDGSEFLPTTETIYADLYAQHTRRVVALVEAVIFARPAAVAIGFG
jgi:hypothetical protein